MSFPFADSLPTHRQYFEPIFCSAGTKLVDHSYNAKRGRRRKTPIGGGVVTRRGKQNNVMKESEAIVNYKIKKSTADVYEFKEDSEEEVKRPRLILTIKSPIEQSQPPVVQITNETPVITETKTTTPVTSSTTSPVTPKSSTNTRKSRRLLVSRSDQCSLAIVVERFKVI